MMLTCQFNDGDTWLGLWLLCAFIVGMLGLLLMHYRAVQGVKHTKCKKCNKHNCNDDYVTMHYDTVGDYIYMN
nr:E5b protein - human papillomavirus type 6e [Human papillomavirus type 6e]